mmetsp:Transcript_17068/g.40348  ORF Transcript_17068/g.40348 Transcript_17068/m.40348 type:complete len:243 (+) Transcript_17068:28-756(+)
MQAVAGDPDGHHEDDDYWASTRRELNGRAKCGGLLQVSEYGPLEALALRGSCVKDGGLAHAMLLVPMGREQRQLLPARLPRFQEARLLAMVRKMTLRGPALEPWMAHLSHSMDQAMIQVQADKQLALAAVKRGLALQHVPLHLQDRKLVLAAVRTKARALESAPPDLQKDREVVLAALMAPGGHRAVSFAQSFGDPEVQDAAKQARARQQRKLADKEVKVPEIACTSAPSALPDEIMCLLHL